MIEPRLLEYLLNSLWQVPVLALATALAITLLQPGQRTRYTLWTLTLLAATLLPLHSRAQAYTPQVHTVTPTPIAIHLIAIAYALTILLSVTRLYLAHRRTLNLLADSLPRPLSSNEQAILATLTTRPIEIRTSLTTTPLLLGIRRPTILLPDLPCTPHQFTAILAHELAHLHRRDLLTDLILRFLSAPIAYHPATALLHRRIRHTRELLCDATAAHALPSPHIYAQSLIELTQQLIPANPHAGLAFFNPKPSLEDRIMHLITPPPTRTQRLTRIATAAALVTASAFTATSFHLVPTAQARQLQAPTPGSLAPSQTVPVQTPIAVTEPVKIAASPTANPSISPEQPTPSPVTVPAEGPAAIGRPITILSPATESSPMIISVPRAPGDSCDSCADGMIVQTSQDAEGHTVARELTPAEREKLNLDMEQLKQRLHENAKNLKLQQPELKALQQSLNSPEFRKQINIVNSPEFKQQIQAINKQTRDSVQLQFTNNPDWQNLQKQLRETRFPDITKDPAYQKFLADIRTQTRTTMNDPALKAQIADASRLGELSRTQRADELAQAAASITEAQKSVTDEAVRRQLAAALADIDRARQPGTTVHLINPKP